MSKNRKLLFFLPLALIAMMPIPADASWSEAGHTILTLDETLLHLESQSGHSRKSSLAGNTPVIFPGDPSELGEKSINAALVLSGLALLADGEVVRPHALSEAARAERRNIPHFANTPRGGDAINSGGLVLFGQVYNPPYQVEVSMGGVLINGVSIYPSPGDAATPPTPSEEQISAHSRLESAGADFAQNRDQGELQEAQQNLAELMLERPEIEAARWINEQELQLVHRDGSIEMIIITDEGREPDDDRVSAENEALENMATGLRRTLTENYTVMAGATYLLTVTHANAHSFRERIEELRTSTESEAMKLARLQAWTGQRNAAADLLYNQ